MLIRDSFKTKAVFFQEIYLFIFLFLNQGRPGPKGLKGEPVFAQGSLKGMKVTLVITQEKMQYKKLLDVPQVAGLILQVHGVNPGCLSAELCKRPCNNFINNSTEYSQNLELLGL